MLSPRSNSESTEAGEIHVNGSPSPSPSGSPDLDIDSDNTNGFNLPDRSAYEDNIEDSTSYPGKILLVNDGDSDANGVPNFADGINLFDNESGTGGIFAPIVLQLAKPFNDQITRVKFTYPSSDPGEITRTGTSGDGYKYVPASGALRIWTKDGTTSRHVEAVQDGGDFVKSEFSYLPSLLGFGPEKDTVIFYLEAVAPSQSSGDLRILLETIELKDGEPTTVGEDAVRVSAFRTSLVKVTGDTTTEETEVLDVTHAPPNLQVSTLSVSNLRSSVDGTKLLGDISVSGTLSSPICDTLAGSDGIIDSVSLYLNGGEAPIAEIATSVSKGVQQSFKRPYPFSATFSTTLTGVELITGYNTFRITATDVDGLSSYGEGTVEVKGAPPVVYLDHELELTLANDPLQTDAVDTLHAKLVIVIDPYNVTTIIDDLVETGVNTKIFKNAADTFRIGLTPYTDPPILNKFIATVFADEAEVSGEMFDVELDSLGVYRGLNTRVAGEDYFDKWFGWTFESEAYLWGGNGTSSANLYMMKLVGPEAVLSMVDHVETEAGNRPVRKAFDNHYYVFEDASKPSVMRCSPILDQISSGIGDAVDFITGFAKGFWDGGVGLVSGLWTLAKFVVKEGLRLSPIGFVYVMTFGDRYASERAFIASGIGFAKTLANIMIQIQNDQTDIITSILAGDIDSAWAISEPYVLMLELGAEIFEQLLKLIPWNSPEEKGYTVGRITFEIVTLLVAELKLGQLSKAAFFAKLKNLAIFQSGKGGVALDALEALIQSVKTTSACFVAGTKVHTQHGLKNIEEIRVGDYVLSMSEDTKETSYKPVVGVLGTTTSQLAVIAFKDAVAITPINCTPQHPFFSVDRGVFVRAAELEIGERVGTHKEGYLLVDGITIQKAPKDVLFNTYNIEIDEAHTYFVGPDGLWVHNQSLPCQRIWAIYWRYRNQAPSTETAFETLLKVKQRIGAAVKKLDSKAWRMTAKNVSDGMFDDVAANRLPVNRLPSFTEWKANFKGAMGSPGRVKVDDIHIHHAVEGFIQEKLGMNAVPGWDPNAVPGYLMYGVEHTGAGPSTLAAQLNKAIGGMADATTNAEKLAITTKLKNVYLGQNPPLTNLWEVAKKWLTANGIPTP